jgi:hypothetical protein
MYISSGKTPEGKTLGSAALAHCSGAGTFPFAAFLSLLPVFTNDLSHPTSIALVVVYIRPDFLRRSP